MLTNNLSVNSSLSSLMKPHVDDKATHFLDFFLLPSKSVCCPPPILFIRPEMVVGWYHSHPGFGCWLSGVDINTQQSFEALSERAVAVVVDPIQSVKGKVMLCDCCRRTL